ncbi:MAG: J domain-containing protein [Pirellulaceae bacterium]
MHDDYYQALWVPRDATDDEIKKAYYALARECHPDLHPNDEKAKRKFQRIQCAFEVLGDQVEREKYNRDYDAKFRRIPLPEPPPPPSNSERDGSGARDVGQSYSAGAPPCVPVPVGSTKRSKGRSRSQVNASLSECVPKMDHGLPKSEMTMSITKT